MRDTIGLRATRVLALVSALASGVSCTVGPDYVRPPVAVPPAYKEAAGAMASQPRGELPQQARCQRGERSSCR